jgi:hypothetical protein
VGTAHHIFLIIYQGHTMPKRLRMSFQEKPFLYNWEEWQRWCDPEDKITVSSILDKCGDLVKPKESISGQAKKGKGSQHYPEVKYALFLERKNKGFRDNIVYENYTLSYKSANELVGKHNLHAIGTNYLRKVFSDEFFNKFDRLYEINADSIEPACENMHVDLCAINSKPRQHQVQFCEVKKYDRGKNKTELLPRDQLLVLGFVRHIIETLGEKAFYHKIYKVKTELIVFVAMDDSRLLNLLKANPREHYVEFVV